MKKDSVVYPVFFMTALTVVMALILGILNASTEDIIAYNANLDLQRKILYVFDMYEEGVTSDEEVTSTFNESIEETKNSKDQTVYGLKGQGSDEIVAYAVPFSGPGLWGAITGYVGITGDLTTLTGIEFIEQNETPGLGGRISEPEYKEQFRGVEIDPSNDLHVVNRPANNGNIDAVSGATQTSNYVESMVNDGLNDFFMEVGGNNGQ